MRFDISEYLVSTISPGTIGSGKSFLAIKKAAELLADKRACIVVFDEQGSTTREIAYHAKINGRSRDTIIDMLRKWNRVLGGIKLEASNDPDPIRANAINNKRMVAFIDALWAAAERDGENQIPWRSMPQLSQGMFTVLTVMMHSGKPLRLLPYLLVPGDALGETVLNSPLIERSEKAKRARTLLRRWLSYGETNTRLFEEKLGAPTRLIDQSFENLPSFRERCQGNFDWLWAIQNKKNVLFDGSDDEAVSAGDVTATFRCQNMQIYRTLQQYYAIHGKMAGYVVVIFEEAAATGLIGPAELDMFRRGRKYGYVPWIVTQDLEFLDPRMKRAVLNVSRRLEAFNPGLDGELATLEAEAIAYPQLNPYLVHSEEEIIQQLHDGYQHEERKGHSKLIEHGEHIEKHHTETTSMTAVPIYKLHKRKQTKYVPLDDQVKMKRSQIVGLGRGQCMIRHLSLDGWVYVSEEPETVEPPKDDFPESEYPGLKNKWYLKMAEESAKADYFITPQPITLPEPCEPTIENSGTATRPANGKAKSNGTSRPRSKPNGRRRSGN